MVSASRLIVLSLAAVQGSAFTLPDNSVLLQESVRYEKPKPHVNLQREDVKAEEEVIVSSELEDIDDTRMEYIRAGVATMKKLKTVGNLMKVLTGQTSYANVMPLLQQAFKSERFLSTVRAVSQTLTKNATESQRSTDKEVDGLKSESKTLETDEAVITLLQNFYEGQRSVTLETIDGLGSAFGALVASLPPKVLKTVQTNLKVVIGAMQTPLRGVARSYEKFINTKPEHACRELGYILRNTTAKKDSFTDTFQELELTAREFPTVVKGVVPAEALENATKTMTDFISACHAVYRNFDHNNNNIIVQVGSITQKRLNCNWKQDASMASPEANTMKEEKKAL